jgi:pilus assembly protein CpaB
VNRLTVVAIAAVVALGSGFALVKYVSGADARATESVQPVQVLVAQTDLPDGTPFDTAMADGRIALTETLRSALAPTAVTDPASLAGLVTDGVLRAGQIVVAGTFVDPKAQSVSSGPPTFADGLPEGTVAVSFEAKGSAAVSDLISPGDHVNLLVSVPNASELGLPDSGGPAVVHVFQDLEIIAIGAAVKPPEGAEEPVANPGAGTYTVAVAPRDAARLLFLTRQYEVLLALVGPGNAPAAEAPVGKVDALPPTLTPQTATGGGG